MQKVAYFIAHPGFSKHEQIEFIQQSLIESNFYLIQVKFALKVIKSTAHHNLKIDIALQFNQANQFENANHRFIH